MRFVNNFDKNVNNTNNLNINNNPSMPMIAHHAASNNNFLSVNNNLNLGSSLFKNSSPMPSNKSLYSPNVNSSAVSRSEK